MAAHGVHTILVGVDGSQDRAAVVRATGGPVVPAQPRREEIAARARGAWIEPLSPAGVRHRAGSAGREG